MSLEVFPFRDGRRKWRLRVTGRQRDVLVIHSQGVLLTTSNIWAVACQLESPAHKLLLLTANDGHFLPPPIIAVALAFALTLVSCPPSLPCFIHSARIHSIASIRGYTRLGRTSFVRDETLRLLVLPENIEVQSAADVHRSRLARDVKFVLS